MRVAIVGAGAARKNERSVARAIRSLGHECRIVNATRLHRRLGPLAAPLARRLVDAFRPDFVLLTRWVAVLGVEAVRGLVRGREAALWQFDLAVPPMPEVVEVGRVAGAMYVTCLAQVEAYRAAGVGRVGFLPQGVDPLRDRPASRAPRRYRCDVSFVGSGQYPHRHELLRAVAAVADLQIRGPGWRDAPRDLPVRGGPIWGRGFARVVRGAAISLGANAFPEQDSMRACLSDRLWRVTGCAGLYLGRWTEGAEAFARGGEHCLWYRDTADAVEQVQQYLSDAAARRRIATCGREHALEHHTYTHRVALLLAGRDYTSS